MTAAFDLEREVRRLRGDGGRSTLHGELDMSDRRIGHLRDPRKDSDAATKRYVDQQVATVNGAGGSNFLLEDDISGAGTSHSLSQTPASATQVAVWLNGQRLKRVSLAPTNLQFTVSGTTVTTGYTLTSGDTLIASYPIATSGTLIPEEVLGTGTVHVLANTPTAASAVVVFLNGMRLKRVSSGPTSLQFSVSGATVTTGYSVTSGDTLVAMYSY
jgi:hypothetical protein